MRCTIFTILFTGFHNDIDMLLVPIDKPNAISDDLGDFGSQTLSQNVRSCSRCCDLLIAFVVIELKEINIIEILRSRSNTFFVNGTDNFLF